MVSPRPGCGSVRAPRGTQPGLAIASSGPTSRSNRTGNYTIWPVRFLTLRCIREQPRLLCYWRRLHENVPCLRALVLQMATISPCSADDLCRLTLEPEPSAFASSGADVMPNARPLHYPRPK